MKPIRIRPLAETDIDHAVAYIWRDNPVAATQLLDALEEGFSALSHQPAMGSPRYAHLIPGNMLRMWKVDKFPYLVFYLEHEDHLDVVRVLHEVRDIPALLGED